MYVHPLKSRYRSFQSVAVVGDMGLMGPDGLTDVTGTGAGGALLPGEE